MDTRNGLVTFGLMILLFVFAFVFCLDALGTPNATYGVLAIIGFIACIGASLYNGMLSAREGEGLALWYRAYSVLAAIAFVWFLTRCGTAFGWW
ncbi:MAG: hypothetical protein NT080_00875 [Spirochaetes bacterium]|nr:hypothetical protein [Spirochaetota bacterium]